MSKSLKVLFIVHNQTRKGGAYYRGQNLGAALARRGHAVTLMSIHPRARLKVVERDLDGVNLVETPDLLWGTGRTGWDPWNTMMRATWIRRRTFDVIHTVDTRPAVSLPAMLARQKSGAVWVADWTDWWGRGGATTERDGWLVRTLVGPLEQWFEERPRPRADATVVISRALGRRAESLGIDRGEILYLPPGADPGAIRTTRIDEAREKCGLHEHGPLVGYLGNIYQRDANLIFNAMARLKALDARLLMVGDPGCRVPGSMKPRVIVTGRLSFDKMLDHLSACNVLVLPLSDTITNRGRWPSKVNEYVAVGRPTVACSVGDVADLMRDNEIGLLVRPDPAEFAARIDELLANPVRSAIMGDRARQVALTTYSQDAVADKLEDFYLRTIAARAARH
jgi:glycosyltransferase involved in cell wall biosynthesis